VTFIVVLFAWLFFRAPDLTTAAYFLESIIHWKGSDLAMDLFFITLSYYIVSFFFDFVEHRYGELFMRNLNIVYQLAILMPVWIVIVMYLFSIGKPMPFIYFQF